MFGSAILDVAIGLTFVFLILSLIASAIQEALQIILKSRSVQLELGIRELLNDKSGTGLVESFYQHPLIASLFEGGYTPSTPRRFLGFSLGHRRLADLPSYIPARNFAVALLDLAVRGRDLTDGTAAAAAAPPITLEGVRIAVHRIQNVPVQRALLTAIDMAEGDLQQATKNVQDWYDSSMDRVSGWYKRNTQKMLLAIGFLLAVVANADSIALARFLYHDKPARDAIVAQAGVAAADAQFQAKKPGELVALLDSLPLGLSRSEFRIKPDSTDRANIKETNIASPLLGWLLTAFAVSLGAPIWFDLLNKFMVIRSTVKPKEKSPEEGSEDRQDQKPASTNGSPAPGLRHSSGYVGAEDAGARSAAALAADNFARQQWEVGPDPDEGVI